LFTCDLRNVSIFGARNVLAAAAIEAALICTRRYNIKIKN